MQKKPLRQGDSVRVLAELKRLTPLPETACELCQVAQGLGADPDQVRRAGRATGDESKRLSADARLAR